MTEVEDLKGRTCVTCACSWVIEPTRIASPDQPEPGPPKSQMICRLHPPVIMMTQAGPKLTQQPTAAYISCWQWRARGTLPGDADPLTGQRKIIA
jgi:hypothetical protein